MEGVELISNVGFPIAVCLILFRQYRDERERATEERERWLEAIKEHTAVVRDLRADVRQVATDGGEDEARHE